MNKRCIGLWLLAMAVSCEVLAADPAIIIDCPAIRLDNDNRNRSTESNPTPVFVVAIGRVRTVRGGGKRDAELVVERTLFGPRFGTIPLTKVDVPKQTGAMIYCLSFPERPSEFKLTISHQYEQDRIFPLDEEPAVSAMSQAQMDAMVLGSESIFIGRPGGSSRGINRQRAGGSSEPLETENVFAVKVDRLLHGSGPKQGETVYVNGKNSPLPAGESFIYFANRIAEVETWMIKDGKSPQYTLLRRWPAADEATVEEALKRDSLFSIKKTEDRLGGKLRTRTITFQGSRAQAIELLGSTYDSARRLATDRLLVDGKAALADVVAAVESDLFRKDPGSSKLFTRQENLIALLSDMENHRSDGEVVRLTGRMLDEIQKGADFPFDGSKRPTTDHWHNSGYGKLGNEVNHSLAWLLRSLDERDAAQLFGKRLLKLRDLSAYGWLNEIQHVVDRSHVEDQLELIAIEPQAAALIPKRWRVGAGHTGRITNASFVDDKTLLKAEADNGVACVWDINSGKLKEQIGEPQAHVDRRMRRTRMVHVSEDRSVQYVFSDASEHHGYAPPSSYEIGVAPPPPPRRLNDIEGDDMDEKSPLPKRGYRKIGTIELKWGQYEPMGLVPDRVHFFIGTHIFRRDDLRLLSATNVSGMIELVVFSEDGSRYAVVTSDHGQRSTTSDIGTIHYRVRIHDSKSGKTLLAVEGSSQGVACVALTRLGERAAIIGNDKSVQVWPLPSAKTQQGDVP